MSIDHLRNPYEKAEYLKNLLITAATTSQVSSTEYSRLRQEVLSYTGEVYDNIPFSVRTHRDLSSFRRALQNRYPTYQERSISIENEFEPFLAILNTNSLRQSSTNINGPVIPTPVATKIPMPHTPSPVPAPNIFAKQKNKVFIVHGRDNAAKETVARFITELGLTPIILHEQANSGMTIIEKIEHYSSEADFGLVLYTPCDQGRGMHELEANPRFRARQNVVFEHGYLMGKLGRKNILALLKDNIEVPNDISGVVYEPLDEYGGWKERIRQELKSCGYKLNS